MVAGKKVAMEHWIHDMRQWILVEVLRPLVRLMSQFEERGIDLTRDSKARGFADHLSVGQTSGIATPMSAMSPQQQQQNQMQYYNNVLERYLSISGTWRAYVVRRIKALAAAQLNPPTYVWNGGSKESGFSGDMPTDAQLIAHLFFTTLDIASVHPDFTERHFFKAPSMPQPNDEVLAIVQASVSPLHYEVIAQGPELSKVSGRNTIPVQQVRSCTLPTYKSKGLNNLFMALCWFVYCVKRFKGGALGSVVFSRIRIPWKQSPANLLDG
jgi:hypothetical protein